MGHESDLGLSATTAYKAIPFVGDLDVGRGPPDWHALLRDFTGIATVKWVRHYFGHKVLRKGGNGERTEFSEGNPASRNARIKQEWHISGTARSGRGPSGTREGSLGRFLTGFRPSRTGFEHQILTWKKLYLQNVGEPSRRLPALLLRSQSSPDHLETPAGTPSFPSLAEPTRAISEVAESARGP